MTQKPREEQRELDQSDLAQWLRRKLLAERETLEVHHKLLLDEFAKRLALAGTPVQQEKSHVDQTQQFSKGDTVKIIKTGHLWGKVGTVCGTDSNGRVKVEMANKIYNTKTYEPEFLEIVEVASQREEEEEQSKQVPNACDQSKPAPILKSATVESNSVASTNSASLGGLDNFVHKDEEYKGFVNALVKSKKFELFWGIMILMNMVVMAFESQYVGLGVGHTIGYANYNAPKEEVWPIAQVLFRILDMFFGIMYTAECILKIVGLKVAFFDRWNVFDVLIVAMWYIDNLASKIKFPIDMMLLRLLRLARLLRLIKLAKAMRGFDQLFLVLTALKGSGHMMLWTAFYLVSCLVSFAFLINQVMVNYVIADAHVPPSTKIECFQYFGTFSRSIFSMFELTLANWIPISRFLIEDVNEMLCIFTIVYKLTFGFAVIAILNGCFIKETFRVASQDDLCMVLEKTKDKQVQIEKMKHFLNFADSKHEGFITLDKLRTTCQVPEIKSWLGAQGIDASDVEKLWQLLDDDDSGRLQPDEFTKGLSRLKGPARSLDMEHFFLQEARREHEMLRREEELKQQLDQLARVVENIQGTCMHALELDRYPIPKDKSTCL